MRRTVTALCVAGLLLVGCSSTGGRQAATSTTGTPITIGDDPTQAPTTSPEAAAVQRKVLDALERQGFKTTEPKKKDVEGGQLFGMTHSWVLDIEGVETFFNLFDSTDSLAGWLDTAKGMGGVVVFDAASTWALSLDSDMTTRSKGAQLALRVGRALKTGEGWEVRTIGTS